MKNAYLIVHVIHRLEIGGLETMLVERINRMPSSRFRHAIICLTDYTDFSKKISKSGVALFSLQKSPGISLITHYKLWKVLRQLKPEIVHTYNLPAVEYGFAAALAGVPVRVCGLHGRDAGDPEGKNRRHNILRRALVPFYDCCYSNSSDLQAWNKSVIGVPNDKNRLLHNGVDIEKYKPKDPAPSRGNAYNFPGDCFVVGTVGRLQDVKNHLGLVDAFINLLETFPDQSHLLRLAIIGDGPLMSTLKEKVTRAGIADKVWIPGARSDIENLLCLFSVFVLSSIAEGTPGAALEAMSAGLPVVGTRVGGIPEVVEEGVTGQIVPPRDPEALARALGLYLKYPELRQQHGMAGRDRVRQRYSMSAMLDAYMDMYDSLCKKKIRERNKSCVE